MAERKKSNEKKRSVRTVYKKEIEMERIAVRTEGKERRRSTWGKEKETEEKIDTRDSKRTRRGKKT